MIPAVDIGARPRAAGRDAAVNFDAKVEAYDAAYGILTLQVDGGARYPSFSQISTMVTRFASIAIAPAAVRILPSIDMINLSLVIRAAARAV